MGEVTKVEWTDHTWSPWWGCARVSPGCENCYAETFSKRIGHGKRLPQIWGVNAERKFFGASHWAEPLKWNAKAEKAGKRARVFCASMSDVFEDREDLVAPRARLAAVIRKTQHLDWLLLTKRPQNAARLWRTAWEQIRGTDVDPASHEWLDNVWLGTTVEDRARRAARIREIRKVPARVRFISCEPLLEDLCDEAIDGVHWLDGIDWVIVGGESGPAARPFDIDWARSIVKQCRSASAACFVKQFGARPSVVDTPIRMKDRKGGDWSEWPEDLRVREWPEVLP